MTSNTRTKESNILELSAKTSNGPGSSKRYRISGSAVQFVNRCSRYHISSRIPRDYDLRPCNLAPSQSWGELISSEYHPPSNPSHHFYNPPNCRGRSFLERDQYQAVKHQNTSRYSYRVHTPFHGTRHYPYCLLSYLFLSLFESYPLQMSVEGISKISTVQYRSMEA